MTLQWIDWLAIGAYVLVIACAGSLLRRRPKRPGDIFPPGGSLAGGPPLRPWSRPGRAPAVAAAEVVRGLFPRGALAALAVHRGLAVRGEHLRRAPRRPRRERVLRRHGRRGPRVGGRLWREDLSF